MGIFGKSPEQPPATNASPNKLIPSTPAPVVISTVGEYRVGVAATRDARLALAVDLGVIDAEMATVRNAFLLAIRSRFGAALFTPDEALRVLVKSGDKLRAISLVVDHVPASKDEAHWVQFLNREASCVVGFEKLARLRQYPVVLASRRRVRRGHYEVTFEILGEPPYDSQSFYLVERYMASLEQSIIANPADWLWNYRRWRNKKPFYA